MKFEVGDKVVCINNRNRMYAPDGGEVPISVGQAYEVLESVGDMVKIVDNWGAEIFYFSSRFKLSSTATLTLSDTASALSNDVGAINIKGDSSKIRKNKPLFSGCLMYFPDALLAVSEHSKKANDKHNPGEPLHWSKEKSKDHADCVARHLLDIGPDWTSIDPEFGSYHATALAWRALALLQTILERESEKK